MLIPTIVLGGFMYYFFPQILADELAIPDVIARHLMPAMERVNFILFTVLPMLFALMLTWAVILSYRFVAPLERLEEDLEKIDEGDYSVRLQVGKDHDLAPIANVINDLVDKLDKNIRKG